MSDLTNDAGYVSASCAARVNLRRCCPSLLPFGLIPMKYPLTFERTLGSHMQVTYDDYDVFNVPGCARLEVVLCLDVFLWEPQM